MAGKQVKSPNSKKRRAPSGAPPHFFLGFVRVSTMVVEGLRSASRTGMYWPVRASRPILFEGGFFAIVV